MNILPPFSGTDYAEVQVFDNRHQITTKKRSGKAAMKVKISTLTVPELDFDKATSAANDAAMQSPGVFVKSVQKRVTSKTLTRERAAEVRAIAHDVDRHSLVGLVKENDICVVLDRDDRLAPFSVTLHYSDGQTIFVEDGFGRDENASPNAAIWRQYHDPNGFHRKHGSGPILAALNRTAQEKMTASVSEEVVAEFRGTVDILADAVAHLIARVDELHRINEDLMAGFEALTSELAELRQTRSAPVIEAPPEPASAFGRNGFTDQYARHHGGYA